MTPDEFCDKHDACDQGRAWAAQFGTMAECWDALVADATHYEWAWWVAARAMTPQARTLLVCRVVRHTPLGDGRTVWDLLTDERSRTALAVADAWAREATGMDLLDARVDAKAAAYDAYAACATCAYADAEATYAAYAAWSAADAAWSAVYAARSAEAAAKAACAAAKAARAWQMDQLRALPNPFEEVTP